MAVFSLGGTTIIDYARLKSCDGQQRAEERWCGFWLR